MKIKTAIFEEDIKPEVLINKRVNFGMLDSYINLYNNYLIKGLVKHPDNYDLVFSIILSHLLSKSQPLIVKHSKEILSDLKEQFNRLKAVKDLYIFDNVGISNADYFIQNTSQEQEYRRNIPILTIIKILKITDDFFKIEPRYNEDSLRRFINIYDLISLNHKSINRDLLIYEDLNLELNFKSFLLKVESE